MVVKTVEVPRCTCGEKSDEKSKVVKMTGFLPFREVKSEVQDFEGKAPEDKEGHFS